MSKSKTDHFGELYSQLSVEELRAKAAKAATVALRRGQTLEPVVIEGQKIARSWWGQAWCRNLERYADYASRLPRGRRYVRSGAVVDLQITAGLIRAKVQGSRRSPYRVEIRIAPLDSQRQQELASRCGRHLSGLAELASGAFPAELEALFFDGGLFPSPREIDFSCSCPDWAQLCKHVAASLYGVGRRLDDNPFLFFLLRGVEPEVLLRRTVQNRLDMLLANADAPSPRALPEEAVSRLFGVL